MLYLGIDQHSKQLTVCLRDEEGEIVLRRQVSTRPEKIEAFFSELLDRDRQFMAIVEVCGFNDWLLAKLEEVGCQEIVLIHPDKTTKKKTDRRDANKLCELLWLNRKRLSQGKRVNGLRRVHIPEQQDKDARQITSLRKRLAQRRTRTLNQIHRALHRHNIMWNYPTKTFQSKAGRKWLADVELPAVDRMELDLLLAQWKLWDEQIATLDEQIVETVQRVPEGEITNDAQLLMSIPGLSFYGALAIASRIGDIRRFPSPRALANYFGLTPGCRNSGNTNHRLGSITKEGSSIVRFILGQLVIHILRHNSNINGWYKRVKRRRGSKIARVAVMRKLLTIMWHMLRHREAYNCQHPDRRSGSPKGTEELQTVS